MSTLHTDWPSDGRLDRPALNRPPCTLNVRYSISVAMENQLLDRFLCSPPLACWAAASSLRARGIFSRTACCDLPTPELIPVSLAVLGNPLRMLHVSQMLVGRV